jgi:hypothetical protein
MKTRSKVWLAGSVLGLGIALNWYVLIPRTDVQASEGAIVERPVVANSHAVNDRAETRDDLEDLHRAIAKLQDAVRRLDATADQAGSRIEASEALAQSVHERVAVLEASLHEPLIYTSDGEPGDNTTAVNRSPPDPDGEPAAQQEADPIEQAAESFYAQRIDQRKTNDVVSRIEQEMAQGAMGNSDLISTECNDSTCRAVVQHGSGEDALQFDLDLPAVVGTQFDSFVTRRTDLGDGFYETEIYMARAAER